ncbi:tumor necrosis factor b (TNF superfamily, member 2) [Micropterus dolomieu]|uniref:tumor necrosis factor b (TNF superfamily, member 2) n=1 Tax=Micropterus dolomieu TaxID=147949 RepID=UPI001E8D0489|nr:tumor necrosis factor b (TNF superfamily, member 2) [Micropterus dolomieu]
MVAYTTTLGDVEMGLEDRTVVLVEKKSCTGQIWKASGALLIVALCLGGVLLFAWCWNGRPEIMMQSGQTEAQVKEDTSKKTDPHYTLSRISSKAKAAIHLEGIYNDESSENQLEWRNDQGQAFAQGGFQLVKNQIVIPQTGLYFVYSQASFRVSCSNGNEERAGKGLTPLSHRVWRYSDSIGGNASLMSAVRSVCQNTAKEDNTSGHGWYNAIYLGAVFQLNKGDKLWTETNQSPELETDEGETFFGAFAL